MTDHQKTEVSHSIELSGFLAQFLDLSLFRSENHRLKKSQDSHEGHYDPRSDVLSNISSISGQKYPVTWSYIMVPHGDEVFWGHIINKVLIEVHLTVNSKYPWTHPVPMSQLPKASSNRHIWYLTNSLHCRTFFGMYKNIYYYEGGQVGSLAEIVIPKQFCISGRKMKEISITLKDLKSSKKIKC